MGAACDDFLAGLLRLCAIKSPQTSSATTGRLLHCTKHLDATNGLLLHPRNRHRMSATTGSFPFRMWPQRAPESIPGSLQSRYACDFHGNSSTRPSKHVALPHIAGGLAVSYDEAPGLTTICIECCSSSALRMVEPCVRTKALLYSASCSSR